MKCSKCGETMGVAIRDKDNILYECDYCGGTSIEHVYSVEEEDEKESEELSHSANFCIHCGKNMPDGGWECVDCVSKVRKGNGTDMAQVAEPNEKPLYLGYVGPNNDLHVKAQDIKNLQYLLDYLPTRQIFATGTLTRAIIALGGKSRDEQK